MKRSINIPRQTPRSLRSPLGDWRRWYGRSARAVAALNHPNICTLHHVGFQAPSRLSNVHPGNRDVTHPDTGMPALAADLKLIYRAATTEMAERALSDFREKYPRHDAVADVGQRNWQRVIPFFDFPEDIR